MIDKRRRTYYNKGMKRMALIFSSGVIAVVAITSLFALTFHPPTSTEPVYIQQPDVKSEKITEEKLLKLVNDERARVGVKPLEVRKLLNASAQFKADDMSDRNYYEHEDPDTGKKNGVDKIFELTGSLCRYGSENIVGDSVNPTQIVDSWMGSKSHREALLDPKYTLTGFGIAKDTEGEDYYIVEHFCEVR